MGNFIIIYIVPAILIILFIVWLLKSIKPKEVIKTKVINVNNEWIAPGTPPPDNRDYTPVLVTIINLDGSKYVTEATYERLSGTFKGMSPGFHKKVIAWMPYPEPYDGNITNALNKTNESGKSEAKN